MHGRDTQLATTVFKMNTNELQQYFAQQAIDDRNQTQGMSCLIDTLQSQAEEQLTLFP